MPIIQFVLPSKNKHIKKLLQCVGIGWRDGDEARADARRAVPQLLLGDLPQD